VPASPPNPAPPPNPGPPPDPESIVELTATPTEFEAEAIAGALRAQGVEARVVGGLLAGFRAEAPATVRVMVRAADLETARNALRALKADSIDIDWDELDVGDPEPGAPPVRTGDGGLLARARSSALRPDVALLAALLAALVAAFALRLPPPFTVAIGAGVLLMLVKTAWRLLADGR
jgi:hypothetical protein